MQRRRMQANRLVACCIIALYDSASRCKHKLLQERVHLVLAQRLQAEERNLYFRQGYISNRDPAPLPDLRPSQAEVNPLI